MLGVGYKTWLPLNAAEGGETIDQLIVILHWFMAVLFVGWGAYFVFCLVRFRARAGHVATTELPHAYASKYAEVVIVIIEAILLLGFSIPIWARMRGEGNGPDPKEALVVRVVAEQFAWNIHYPGRDGIFGRTDVALVTKENPVGLDRSEPAGKDDIVTINQMHVPVDRDVLVHLSSKDVIHNFGLPLLRVKQDAIPGMTIPVWFKATQTTDQIRDQLAELYPLTGRNPMLLLKYHVAMKDYEDRDGNTLIAKGKPVTEETVAKLTEAGSEEILAAPAVPTEIACAQLCGLGHYRMRGYLTIDSKAEYEKWMADEEAWLEDDEEEDDEGY